MNKIASELLKIAKDLIGSGPDFRNMEEARIAISRRFGSIAEVQEPLRILVYMRHIPVFVVELKPNGLYNNEGVEIVRVSLSGGLTRELGTLKKPAMTHMDV